MKYYFVLMLISLSSLATTHKFEKNFCFKMRAVGLINIKTKECQFKREKGLAHDSLRAFLTFLLNWVMISKTSLIVE